MKIYCSCCDKVQPVVIDECRDAKTNAPFQDIVCTECSLVIASGTDIRLAQPEQEPFAFVDECGQLRRYTKKDFTQVEYGGLQRLYTTPPQRKPLMFPTMLRKMWSGGEVQQWLDENYNNGIKGDA